MCEPRASVAGIVETQYQSRPDSRRSPTCIGVSVWRDLFYAALGGGTVVCFFVWGAFCYALGTGEIS